MASISIRSPIVDLVTQVLSCGPVPPAFWLYRSFAHRGDFEEDVGARSRSNTAVPECEKFQDGLSKRMDYPVEFVLEAAARTKGVGGELALPCSGWTERPTTPASATKIFESTE
jgi:hypothetical protein